jgi:hypothetical protein
LVDRCGGGCASTNVLLCRGVLLDFDLRRTLTVDVSLHSEYNEPSSSLGCSMATAGLSNSITAESSNLTTCSLRGKHSETGRVFRTTRGRGEGERNSLSKVRERRGRRLTTCELGRDSTSERDCEDGEAAAREEAGEVRADRKRGMRRWAAGGCVGEGEARLEYSWP